MATAFGAVRYIQFVEDRIDVELHGVLGNFELRGDLLVAQPRGEQLKNFMLARRKRFAHRSRFAQRRRRYSKALLGKVRVKHDEPIGCRGDGGANFVVGAPGRQNPAHWSPAGPHAPQGSRKMRFRD